MKVLSISISIFLIIMHIQSPKLIYAQQSKKFDKDSEDNKINLLPLGYIEKDETIFFLDEKLGFVVRIKDDDFYIDDILRKGIKYYSNGNGEMAIHEFKKVRNILIPIYSNINEGWLIVRKDVTFDYKEYLKGIVSYRLYSSLINLQDFVLDDKFRRLARSLGVSWYDNAVYLGELPYYCKSYKYEKLKGKVEFDKFSVMIPKGENLVLGSYSKVILTNGQINILDKKSLNFPVKLILENFY